MTSAQISEIGHVVLLSGLLMPLTSRIKIELHIVVSLLCYLGLAVFSARSFFDPGPRWRRPRVLAALAAALLTFFVTLTLFFLSILVRQGVFASSAGGP